jgi:hypothetical protein
MHALASMYRTSSTTGQGTAAPKKPVTPVVMDFYNVLTPLKL